MPIEYDKKAARFRDAKGRFISEASMRKQIDAAVERVAKDNRALTRRLNEKQITPAEWKRAMRSNIKTLNTLTAAVGKGGRRQMTKADWGRVGARIKKEYKFLDNFARDIEAGRSSGAQAEYRSTLYARSGRTSFAEFETEANKAAGKTEARRVLHASESCSGCRSAAGKYVPIDDLPRIGSLSCGSNCRCSVEYK